MTLVHLILFHNHLCLFDLLLSADQRSRFFSNPMGQHIIETGEREAQEGKYPHFLLNLKEWKKMHLKRIKLLNIVHVARG